MTQPQAAQEGTSAHDHEQPFTPANTWWPVNLAPIIAGIQAGEIAGPIPQLMARTDGPCLLYPGESHSLAGEPETGKGWIALAETATVITNGGHVLYLDFEDAPASIITRLLALGAAPEAILERFTYVRPSDPFTAATLDALLATHTYTLAVIDGLSEAYTLLGLDPYNNVDAAKFLAALPRPIASTGAAVLLIDHVVKAKEGRGRYALGAQHKLAGITVAYSTNAITTPSRTNAGVIKVKVEKDRHGHVRSHAQAGVIAHAHINPHNQGTTITVTLEPPDASPTSPDGTFRPTNLMEKVSRYIEDTPGASLNTIRKGVPGKDGYVDVALRHLITEGFVARHPEGQTYRHHTTRPYRETDDHGPTARPRPNHGPATVQDDRGPVALPIRDTATGHTIPSHANHGP